MTINQWGSDNLDPLSIANGAGAQTNPAIASNEGTSFGIAWIDGNSVVASFFDEAGRPDPALPTVTLTDSIGTGITDLHMEVGGSGIGYGAAWQETVNGVTQLKLRYVGLAAPVGGEVAISTHTTVNQRDIDISSFARETNNSASIDGFDVAWVEGAGAAHALGTVYLQRFAVPLDAAKDPAGPPAAAGLDGNVAAGVNDAVQIASNARDPAVVGLIDEFGGANETVVTWIDQNSRINIRVYNDNGAQNNNALGVATNNVNTASAVVAAGGQQHMIALTGGGFVLAWVATAGANSFIAGRVFTQNAAAGSFTGGPVIVLDTLDGDSNNVRDFSLGRLTDSGGFTIAWNALDAGNQAIFTRSYSAGGLAQ